MNEATIADDMLGMPTATKTEGPERASYERRAKGLTGYSSARVNARATHIQHLSPPTGRDTERMHEAFARHLLATIGHALRNGLGPRLARDM